MRHRVAGRKLGRTTAHRQALLRSLSTALFDKEKILTTLAKAKEVRPFAEKLVTLAKRETLHARRQVLRQIQDRKVVAKLFDTISARFAQRPGGYTRILKLGPRRGDHAEMAVIELVQAEAAGESEAAEPATERKSRKAAPSRAKKASAEGKKKAARKKAPAKKAKSKKSGTAKPSSARRRKAGGTSSKRKTKAGSE